MKPLGSVAAVIAAVSEDAQAEVESIERDATGVVARIASADDARVLTGDAAAIAVARERARTRVAQEDWEDARNALAEREQWIAAIVELGLERLAQPLPAGRRRDMLARLADEGLSRLPAGPVIIEVPPGNVDLLDNQWREHLAEPSRISVVARPMTGGCVIRSADGRAVFDNTYPARIDRLQSRWRSVLSELYERATSAAGHGAP